MRKLNEILSQAQNDSTAIGHFNVADLVLLKAVFGAARELNVPVLVGASEGEQDFTGTRQLAAVVNSLREEFDFPIFLNADHTHSLAKALEAAKAGFNAVVFDPSTLPLVENAKHSAVRCYFRATGRQFTIETLYEPDPCKCVIT